jgi:hypothetical protein
MKIIVWMVIPAIIMYIFWVTYKIFNRTAPESGSREEIAHDKNDYV